MDARKSFWAAAVLVLGAATRLVADGDFGGIEEDIAQHKARMAKVWLDLAGEMGKRDLKTEALDAVAKAKELAPDDAAVAEAQRRADALAGKGTLDESARKAIDKAKRTVAKGYDALAAVLEDEKQDSRYTAFLVAALGTEPTKERLRVLSEMAKKEPLLLQAPGHPFSALVSLPKSWRSGKEYPVLVCLEGEEISFDLHMNRFRDERGSREWILVCPHTLTSAVEVKFDRYPGYPEALVREWNFKRLEFDEAGFLPLLDFLRVHFGAAGRVALAGHSTGAVLGLRTVLAHPGRVLKAVVTCPKHEPEVSPRTTPVEDGGPPVLVLTAAKDAGRAADADASAKALEASGFSKVERRTLPGARSEFAKEVWAFVDPPPGR